MSKVIVTGATGSAGSAILNAALASPSIAHVTSISRRPPYITHPKLSTILLSSADFPAGFDEFPPALVERVKDHHAVIWGLGISQTQVNKDEYIKITHDYTMTAVKALSTLGTPSEPFRFIYVSGEGADQSERGMQIFSRIKGRTEKALRASETDGFKTLSVRPGMISPTAEHAQRMGVMMRYGFRAMGAVAKLTYPNMQIAAADLGEVCVALALGGKGWKVRDEQGWIPNSGLRRIVKDLKRA